MTLQEIQSKIVFTPTAVKTANYTAAINELIPTDTTSGNITVTLPNAPADKTQIAVKMVAQGGTNTTTIAAAGTDVFNKAGGSTSLSLSLLNQAAVLQYEAATKIWYVRSTDVPLTGLDLRFHRANYKTGRLTKWINKIRTSPSTAKIIFVGDSTSDFSGNASSIPFYFLSQLAGTGDYLEGVSTGTNYGSNGNTIAGFYDNPTAAKNLNSVIAEAPDLIIFSYGINDIRQNQLTKDQLKTYIIKCVEAFRSALPNCEIVLRMPNSFLIPTDETYIKLTGTTAPTGGYATLALAAQAQTDTLYQAYIELDGYWDNVIVFNSQDRIFGRTVVAASHLMSDAIHPNYSYILDELKKDIGWIQPYEAARTTDAEAYSFNAPWSYYPRTLENSDRYIKIASGRLNAQGSGFFDIAVDNAGVVASKVIKGDIVLIGRKLAVKIVGTNSTAQTATVFRVLQTLPANSISYGDVVIYRDIYNSSSSSSVKGYIDNKNYTYRRRVLLNGGGSGVLFIASTLYDRLDGLSLYTPDIGQTGSMVDFGTTSTSDIILAEDQSPLALTGATFAYFNGGIQINLSGNYSSGWTGVAYIVGTHSPENYDVNKYANNLTVYNKLTMYPTNTASGTTGNRTINRLSGTVNIAAGGSSVTVTNSLVTSASIVYCVIRTNDGTATGIKNVVPAAGSFTINLNAATTAETSIGFVVFN